MVVYRRARDLIAGDMILDGSQSWEVTKVSVRRGARNGEYQSIISAVLRFGQTDRQKEFVVNDMVPVEI
jgi:hypothetical protein